jgi:hypothetical protein
MTPEHIKNSLSGFGLLILIFFLPGPARCGPADSLGKEPVLNQPFRSLQFGMARTSSVFRDFATSPLFYRGRPTQFSLAWAKEEGKKERRFLVRYQSGRFSPENEEVKTPSSATHIALQYSRLWYVGNRHKTDLRVGAMMDLSGNLRINPALQNNAGGLEIFHTLFVSARLSRDLSRITEKKGKILWLIPYRRIPRRRTLSFQLNAALMNNSFRNGYIYSNQANITNKPDIFYNYRFNAFSGYRMNTALEYAIFLGNGNAIRYSWIWEALQTGEEFNRFEMGFNAFQVAFLFQVPKREKK